MVSAVLSCSFTPFVDTLSVDAHPVSFALNTIPLFTFIDVRLRLSIIQRVGYLHSINETLTNVNRRLYIPPCPSPAWKLLLTSSPNQAANAKAPTNKP